MKKKMKRKYKFLLWTLSIVLVLVGVAYFAAQNFAKSALPDYNATIKLKGLKEEVKVYRDSLGIPHIEAKNEADLYLVTGYVMAQDRLWQMDLLRRLTQGRLAEIFGTDLINTDLLFRALQISEKSEKIWAEARPDVKLAATAFSDGVNQYIEEGQLPFEFSVLGYKPEQWIPQNSVNLIGYMAWSLNSGWNSELTLMQLQQKMDSAHFAELIPEMSYHHVHIFPDSSSTVSLPDSTLMSAFNIVSEILPPIFEASNNWAVSGKKSTTGAPIFANDMHLGLMIPGVWSQIHQTVPGKLDVTGVILPGQPFIIAGHNADIAWGMTNVMIDDIDFYIETINPENRNEYKFNGSWRKMRTDTVSISDDKGNKHQKEIRYTHRGPIISGMKKISDKEISMHWLGSEPSNELLGVFLLNRAKDWTSFREAASQFVSVSQNIAYADKSGNIGLQTSAGVPKRSAPGYLVYPGDTEKYDWKGFVPFDSLPSMYNPERGYVYSANNKTTGDSYPHYISAWFDLPNRAERIRSTLAEKEKLSVEDFKLLQNNQKSILAEQFMPSIKSHIPEVLLQNHELRAFNYLTRWDYVYHPDSIAPTIFEKFYMNFAKLMLADEMGDTLFLKFAEFDLQIDYFLNQTIKRDSSVWSDDISTPKKNEQLGDIMLKAFQRTVGELTNTLGENPNKWAWGKVHKLDLQHPLGKVKMLDIAFNLNRLHPVGGSFHTVSPYSYPFDQNTFYAKQGASHRHIYTLDNFDNSQTIIPTGVSGIPGSQHYCDQTEDFVKGKYHADRFSSESVKRQAKYVSTFVPM